MLNERFQALKLYQVRPFWRFGVRINKTYFIKSNAKISQKQIFPFESNRDSYAECKNREVN